MVIGIEAERANNPQKTGVEHYAKQLILHLAIIDSSNQYILYLRTAPEQWLLELPNNFSIKVMPFPVFWTQLRVSWEMLMHPPDALFIPASALPLVHPKKSVVTIHDLGWKFYPQSFTWFMINFLEWSTSFAVSKASNIIAISDSTKKDLINFYNVDPDKVSVVYHGYQQEFSIFPPSLKLRRTGNFQFSILTNLPEKFVLFLSTLQPRKNLEGLIDAFRLLKSQNPELPHKLVVVGKPGWKFEGILKKINENKDIVIYLNYVRDEERFNILKRSDLLILPSFYEGFGMQILEAFEANVPVATSNISSMPEIAGEAAVYFNPKNTTEMANAIKMVLRDKSLADSLREKGKQRLKLFSWEKCARETLDVLTSSKLSS